MPRDFDVIVVGGGHNGLVCAAYLARAGLDVCLLERHARLGGAAVTEEFHPGFRNSVASYTVSLLQPKIIAELELARHGLKILPRRLDNFVPARDGPGLELPGDRGARLAAIARHSEADASRYPTFAAELEAIADWVRPLMLEAPVDPRQGWSEWRRGFAHLKRLPMLRLRAAYDLVLGSAGDWLDRHFETDLLAGALGFDAVVGHFASPYRAGSGYLLLHHALGEVNGVRGGWGHALGGMGAIADALAAAAREAGARLEVERPVERIVPEGGRFAVVAGAETLTATRVVSAVHPATLYLRLLDPASVPARLKARMRRWRSESASLRINVALGELPDFTCLPGRRPAPHHTAGILLTPSLGYLDRAYADALETGMAREPIVELVIPSTLDETLAPAGRHVASLFCQHFRYALPDGRSWTDAKEAAVARVLDAVDELAPNFKRAVLAVDAYTPVDLERRFGLVGGDIFHGVMCRDQLYWSRPASRYAQYRGPVTGLYMCASGAHPGGGVSGAPGHNAARAILADVESVCGGAIRSR